MKSIKPILTRAQINEKLETCGDLQAMSPIVAQVLTVTNSPTSSANQVARLINQDQAMAIKVLKLANSSVYSRGKPVDTVLKAVTRIGMSQIRQVALNISVMENFGDMDIEGYLSCAAFWEHSIACGLVASEITRAMGGDEIEVDSAFTMGLLHDMGRLVYAEVLGKDYTQVLQTAQEMKLPLDHVELRMLLNNHAAAMEHILHAWNFPKELVLPIVMHHLSMGNIRQMARGHVGEVARLALANNLAHALLLGSSGNDTLYCTEDLMRGLKLNGVVFKGIVDKVPEQTRNLKNAMVSESGLEAWKPQKDVVREQLDGPVHSLFVSETPQLDAFAVFFRQIQDKNFGEPPNLGVVHILNVRERDSLTLRFNEMEAAAGISNLPLIVFSPNGNIGLEERTMSKREHVLLPTPIAIARVTDAINYLHAKTGVSVGVGV